MAYVNPFAASPDKTSPEETAASTYTNPFAGGSVEGAGGGLSPFGFIGNIAQGVQDIAGGIVGLVGAGLHDLGQVAEDVLPGDIVPFIEENGAYRLDDVGMGLAGFSPQGDWDPAHYGITGDLWRRYSPLLPGGTPASETFRLLYEEPVSFALDALTIATAGASAAVGPGAKATEAAGMAGKVGEVSGMLTAAGFGARAARRAGIRAGLDEIAKLRNLTATEAWARRMMPSATLTRQGNKLVPGVEAINPLTRATAGKLVNKVTTEPLSALRARVDDMESAVMAEVERSGGTMTKTATQTVRDLSIAKQLLADAEAGIVRRLDEAGNLIETTITPPTRLTSDFASGVITRRVARKLAGEMNAQSLYRRTAKMRQVEATINKWYAVDPTIEARAAGLWQRLDVELVGKESDLAHWSGRTLEWEGMGPAQTVLEVGPSIPLRLQLDDAVRAAADPELLARTDGLVDTLQKTRMRWMEDPQLAELGHNVADQVDSIDRLIDHLNDAVDRRVKASRGVDVDAAILAMDDMRLLNLEHSMKLWDSPSIRGVITPTQMLDRAYLPLRAKYGAKAAADGTLQGGPSAKMLDDALRAHGDAAPIYFPHMDPAELGAWDFFTSKKLRGAARAAQDPNLKRNEAKLLERGSYLTDPMDAFSRRAARAVRAEETYNTILAYGTRLGRPITRADDLGSNEVLMIPEALRLTKRTQVMLQDRVDDLTSRGVNRDTAVWEAVKEVTEANQDDIAALLAGPETVQMFAVPKAAADQLENAAKIAAVVAPKGAMAFYDSAMNAWRHLTLFTRPAYVANQFLGNTAFALMQGSGVIAPLEILSKRFGQLLMKKMGKQIDPNVLARLEGMEGFNQLGAGYFGELAQNYTPRNAWFGETLVGKAVHRAGETVPARLGKRFMAAERQAAIEIDNAFRASGFVTAAERAMGVSTVRRTFRRFRGLNSRIDKVLAGGFGTDGAVVKQALDEAKLFFGDYSAMGPFARHVTRRYLFPWWGFTRHNLNLMARFPIEYPARAEVMLALQRVDEEYMEQYGPIPGWLNGAVPLGPPGSEVQFLSMRGGSPFEGVFQPWTSQLAPAPKMLLERAVGRNLFTDQQFTDPDVIYPFGSDQPYRIIRDEAGNPVGTEPLEGNVLPGWGEHLLNQFPLYTYAERMAVGGASMYDTGTLLDAITGSSIRYDENGEPVGQEGRGSVLAALMGLPVAEYDLESYRARIEREQQSALTAAKKRVAG